ncbi:MAG TPA: hypothetical protein VE987_15670 [Polyangiaceae bacterium]|nr:hypothetical protein [Polyangiaceae bacterium]
MALDDPECQPWEPEELVAPGLRRERLATYAERKADRLTGSGAGQGRGFSMDRRAQATRAT